MKVLILFSAWIPGDDVGDDAPNWMDYYFGLLARQFSECDKIIAFNPGCNESFVSACRNIPNVIHVERVPVGMNINSDASGFQQCLLHARPRLHDYDIVLFLHTKGASRGFEMMEGFRWLFGTSLLDPVIARRLQEGSPHSVHALLCHPPTHMSDIKAFTTFLAECSPASRPFMFNVTYTVYYVSADLLARALKLIPDPVLKNNLKPRFNRFFFELDFPSFLASIGGNINFVAKPAFNDALNSNLSYNYDLRHSTALVHRTYAEYKETEGFSPYPVPMVFGPIEVVRNFSVSFDLFSPR